MTDLGGIAVERVAPNVRELYARCGLGIQQRTEEWYRARESILTASDCASALGIKPFKSYSGNPADELLKKKLDPEPLVSIFLTHGVYWEDAVRDTVCSVLGEPAVEWGLVRSAEHPWLGASPDGVFPLSGRCLELKAPLKREIHVVSHSDGSLMPEHYYAQVQIQMLCCGARETIFAEFKPAMIMPNNRDALSIVSIARDDAWLEESIPKLRAFYDRWQAAKKTHVPRPPKIAENRIIEGLYSDDSDLSDDDGSEESEAW